MKPARVFQVVTRMVQGGAQRVVLQLLRDLPRAEFAPTLVCGSDPAEGDSLLAEARREAPVVLVRELVREVRPAIDARAVLRLARLLARARPDVVHAHTYKAGVVASVAARLVGVRAVVFTPHGHIFARGAAIPGVPGGGWRLEALRWITRAAQACAHRVTALSEVDLRDQLALGLSPASKYRVVRNGIPLERFNGGGGARPRAKGPVIGAVGRFTSEKGHAHLLDAFARLRGRLPGARLVLVGYGELEGDLRRRAEALGLADRVTFAGARDSAEMLPGFDLFVQPSLYESQGLAILEAMAAGVPVVATDVGGVRDAVRPGETGTLVPPADPAALAEALVRLAEDPDRAAGLAAKARTHVREHYSASGMVAAYARLYNELLGRYNSASCTTT